MLDYFYATIISFTIGVMPSILWLLFWLQEDKLQPEPRRIIAWTFIAGMFSSFLALLFQKNFDLIPVAGINSIIIFGAMSEEIAKFGAAYFAALRLKYNDEPIDSMIYLITAALGFTAFENALYLIDPIRTADIAQSFITINSRFIGSTVLHIVSSGVVGLFLAYAYCKSKSVKALFLIIGLSTATLLHTSFNFFILNQQGQNNIIVVFFFAWLGAIVLTLFFEKVKKLKSSCN